MLLNRQALISVLIGGVALCLPMAAHASDWTVKSGTTAQDAGKCLTNITLFDQVSKELLAKETPEYAQMAKAWIDYISGGDEAFSDEAIKAMNAMATRYDGLTRTEKAEDLLAILISEMAGCLYFMQT